jgi:hypothetical protein
MRQSNLVQQIRDAVRIGKVKEPFKSSDFHFLSRSPHNTGLAKVAVQCSADTFVVNQSLVLRINICG